MTANQRRPGFRLPWSPDEADPAATAPVATEADEVDSAGTPPGEPATAAIADPAPAEVPPAPDVHTGATAEATVRTAPEPVAQPDFLRDLVAAMRQVAEEARQAGVTEVRGRADAEVRRLEAETERRRGELTARAESDVAGVGEWAKAEAERIRAEAEQRVAARRAELDQELAAEQARGAAEAKELRDRVAEYERELSAYHAQLAEINDPAAFAAAAKRMPAPPRLDASGTVAAAAGATRVDATTIPGTTGAQAHANGVTPSEPVHAAEEEVLAARLAELDAELPEAGAAVAEEPTTTEIVVRGLGSFGAITGFRQALSGVDGIDSVALSLGHSGEFIFRAAHRGALDVAHAITSLEGDGAKIEPRPEGGLLVTLDRAR